MINDCTVSKSTPHHKHPFFFFLILVYLFISLFFFRTYCCVIFSQTLRIPSTKNVSLIGRRRNFPDNVEAIAQMEKVSVRVLMCMCAWGRGGGGGDSNHIAAFI